MWVFSPGEKPGVQKVGVSSGETGGARKTGVPRTKVFTMYWTIIVYNSQEALSMYMNVLLIYNCK